MDKQPGAAVEIGGYPDPVGVGGVACGRVLGAGGRALEGGEEEMMENEKWMQFCKEAIPHMEALMGLTKKYDVRPVTGISPDGISYIDQAGDGRSCTYYEGEWRVCSQEGLVAKIKSAPGSGNSGGAQE